MLSEAIIERRLTALEQAVRNLEQRLTSSPITANWLDKVIGSVSDDAAFLEALEFGRIYRRTDIETN